MALDVYREIPSVLISTALGLRPRAVLISTSGIFPVYRLKPCVNLYMCSIAIHGFSRLYYQGSCYERCRRKCIGFQKLSQNKYIPKTICLPRISVLHIEYQTDGCENNAHCSNGVVSDSQSKVKCDRDVPWCTIWGHPICGVNTIEMRHYLAVLNTANKVSIVCVCTGLRFYHAYVCQA